MDTKDVVRLLTIANNDLPSVEYRCEKLKREEASLQAGNQNSAIILQELSDQISDLRNTLSYSFLSVSLLFLFSPMPLFLLYSHP